MKALDLSHCIRLTFARNAEPGAPLGPQGRRRYEEHVGHSVELGQRMGLASDVLMGESSPLFTRLYSQGLINGTRCP